MRYWQTCPQWTPCSPIIIIITINLLPLKTHETPKDCAFLCYYPLDPNPFTVNRPTFITAGRKLLAVGGDDHHPIANMEKINTVLNSDSHLAGGGLLASPMEAYKLSLFINEKLKWYYMDLVTGEKDNILICRSVTYNQGWITVFMLSCRAEELIPTNCKILTTCKKCFDRRMTAWMSKLTALVFLEVEIQNVNPMCRNIKSLQQLRWWRWRAHQLLT